MYLTKRQRQMLECIETFIEENGYSPTLEEIGGKLGLSSPATVHKHLQNLEAKGLIRRQHNHSRALELAGEPTPKAPSTLPLLGYVSAGAPIDAIENPEPVEVPREFIGSKDNFVLKVKGESMIDDGIHNGDWIIVERRETALPGQTVVALVNGDMATVKRYYPERGNKIRLQPANSTMEPIILAEDAVQIQGVLVGLMRKYGA